MYFSKWKSKSISNLHPLFSNSIITVVNRYYLTSGGTNKKPPRDVTKERSPFLYPRDVELQAYRMLQGTWEAEQKKKNQVDGSNYRTRQVRSTQTRLNETNNTHDCRILIYEDRERTAISLNSIT